MGKLTTGPIPGRAGGLSIVLPRYMTPSTARSLPCSCYAKPLILRSLLTSRFLVEDLSCSLFFNQTFWISCPRSLRSLAQNKLLSLIHTVLESLCAFFLAQPLPFKSTKAESVVTNVLYRLSVQPHHIVLSIMSSSQFARSLSCIEHCTAIVSALRLSLVFIDYKQVILWDLD